MPAPFGSRQFFRFLHKGLGLKNLADYIEQRQKLLGLTNLDIRTVIDVGANKGRAARRFRRLFPRARVHCVEPIPRLCRRLEQWAETQGGAVRVYELALSRAPSEQPLYVHRRSATSCRRSRPRRRARGPSTSRFRSGSRPWTVWPESCASSRTCWSSSTPRASTSKSSAAAGRRCAAPPRSSSRRRSTPTRPGDGAPTFEDIAAALRDLGYVYRGNVRLGCRHGTPMLADVLFARREAARRLADRA